MAASVLIGLALGLLGGGGSILTVPVLVYLAAVEPKPAIAMSLVVVGVTSAVALIPHARGGRVQWRTGVLFGAGGGFLVVPALVLLGGLPMPTAVGTSLLVIAMKSAAGLAGYLHSVTIDWRLTAAVTAVAVTGSLVGGRLAGRLRPDLLRQAFGWFVIVMGAGVLAGQLAG
ncbi:hypothetical protein CS0771_47450 [Catellatospora sp. IY07-71]|nr:hypothetical protein CS0771_47450 [Catellatospora sp. IY07-71]